MLCLLLNLVCLVLKPVKFSLGAFPLVSSIIAEKRLSSTQVCILNRFMIFALSMNLLGE